MIPRVQLVTVERLSARGPWVPAGHHPFTTVFGSREAWCVVDIEPDMDEPGYRGPFETKEEALEALEEVAS